MRRLPFLIILFALLPYAAAHAQRIRLDYENASLREALVSVGEQAGVDIVFAERLVMDRLITCRYEGRRTDEALACVLGSAGLRAARVRRNQFVIIRDAPSPPEQARHRSPIAGFIMDGRTGEPLPGAHVYLPDLKAGTVSNDAGYFALPALPQGEYRAQITYVGYRPEELRLTNGRAPHTITLQPTTIEGGPILVEDDDAARTDLKTVPGLLSEPVSRLESLPSFPGESDLFQALQWYPGIRQSGEVNGGLVIRGAPPDQNLYLLDGAPVYHPWHAFSLISTFQTETFKDIKLYRGSFPAEFGGRLSSVLEAQMKDGSRSDPGALVALSTLSGRFVVETPATRNSSFMLSGRRSYLDKLIGREHPVEDAEGRRDTLRTGYYFYDASAKYTVRMGRKDRLSLSYYHGGDDLDLRLPFDLSLDFSSWLRPAELFFEVAHRWQNRLLSARYQHLYSQQIFVTATGYYTSYKASEGAFLRPTSSAVLLSDYRVDLTDTGIKVDVDYFHSLAHQVQVGLQAVVRNFNSSLEATVRRSAGSIDQKDEESRTTSPELAVYAQDTWQPTERWTVKPGLRVSIFEGGTYMNVVPGIAAQYVVDPQYLILRAGLDRNVQYLHHVRDRYAFTYDLVSSRWIPASESVRPASSLQVAGGFESRLGPGFLLTGDFYLRDAKNVLLPEDEFRSKDALVGPGIDDGALLGQYVDSETRSYGIELSGALQRGPWNVWLSYAGGKSLVASAEEDASDYHPARFDVPRSFRALVSRNLEKWMFSASADLRSGYPTTVPVSQYRIGDPLDPDARYLYRPHVNNGRLPTYFRLDLTASREFELLGADWSAKLHIYNLTNRRNVVSRNYLPGDDQMDVQNRRGLPILPLLELEMSL